MRCCENQQNVSSTFYVHERISKGWKIKCVLLDCVYTTSNNNLNLLDRVKFDSKNAI